jgi:cytochrome c-type protein NapC
MKNGNSVKNRLIIVLALFFGTPVHAAINWDKVEATEITLFYPGQASWVWLLTEHSAAKSVRKGSPCLECHDGEEKQMGTTIVRGEKLEPLPTKNKPGFITASVQMAQDGKDFYIHIEWKDPNFVSGVKMQKDYKTKLAVMIDDGSVKESNVAGCFAACHDDATGMASHSGNSERTLYLSASREKVTRSGGGDQFKAKDDLEELFANGNLLEYWQIKLNPNSPLSIDEGYILDKRHVDNTHHVDARYDYQNGRWRLELRRALNTNSSAHKTLQDGKKYTIGFALHDDYVKGRYHYVSLGRTFTTDGAAANLRVQKQ